MTAQTDNIENQYLDKKLLKKLYSFLKPHNKYVFIAICLTLVVSALAPLRPFLTKTAIDEYIAISDYQGLLNIVILIVALMFTHAIFQFALAYIMQWVGQNVLYDIRTKLYQHIQKLSMSFFDKNPIGRLVTRVTNDVEGLSNMFSTGVVMVIADILLIIWIIIFMFITNVQLTLFTLIVLPLLLIVTTVFRKKIRVLFRKIRENVSNMNSFLNEYLSGVSTLKLFSQEKKKRDEFNQINIEHKNLWMKSIFQYSIFFPTIEMISTITLGILIWYSAENILSNVMTIGTLIAFLQYSEMFFRPIRDLTEKYSTLQSGLASAERIFSLFEVDDFIEEKDSPVKLLSFKHDIEFENISFSYEKDKQVLKKVSFRVNKGETVAIVGATGSGKTTLINLLLRYYDFDEGDILIDGISIRDFSIHELRKLTALVMQDVFLFSRSINENISLGDKNISLKDIIHAADSIGAGDFISNLNTGFSTDVMERGKTLSAGQRQLISFARAYVANPDILILDEATSNIDSESEKIIENALAKLLVGKTSIIIAHRLSTIKRADKIIVLHHGSIVESGTHQELIKHNGVYSKLYKLQFETN